MAAGSRYRFTIAERVFLVRSYYRYHADYRNIFSDFAEKFPNSQVPRRETVYRLIKRFEQNGTVNDTKRSGRPRSVRTAQNVQMVAESFVETPARSVRKACHELEISRSSLQRIMKELGMHVYRPRLLQALTEDDPDRRLQFAEWYVIRCEAFEEFFKTILWSDEAQFKLNGRINRHNCVYWSTENPHITMQEELNVPGVTVWLGVCSFGIVGPYFFDATVTGIAYLDLLMELREELNNNPDFSGRGLTLQQDGAPPHYAIIVREFLNQNFPDWIGRRGQVEWPARSPDLTPLDFAVWGILKDRVYKNDLPDVETMKNIITNEVDTLNADKPLLERICKAVKKRCLKCIEQEGGHFEHLL